jgi:hypothetical protein
MFKKAASQQEWLAIEWQVVIFFGIPRGSLYFFPQLIGLVLMRCGVTLRLKLF